MGPNHLTKEQSDLGLQCLPVLLHPLHALQYGETRSPYYSNFKYEPRHDKTNKVTVRPDQSLRYALNG